MKHSDADIITVDEAGTLAGLFRARAQRSPQSAAYRHFDPDSLTWRTTTWQEMAQCVARWQAAFEHEGLAPGDRVAIMLRNCREWVLFDQAALGLGLVVVPLYVEDSAENIAYILQDAEARLLLIDGIEHWQHLAEVYPRLTGVSRIVSVGDLAGETEDSRVRWLEDWLPAAGGELRTRDSEPDGLATIVYTSGTTGRSKGVMLTHRNILWNTFSSLQSLRAYPQDLFLSFLPLCHTFERTTGYYLPMMAGSTVAYARSIPQLADDLLAVRPTVLIAVPRIFERVYNRVQAQLQERSSLARRLFQFAVDVGWSRFERAQGRGPWRPHHLLWPLLDRLVAGKIIARLGGRLRIAVAGGAPLAPPIARVFIGLGLPLIQGYGMTEASPVISANLLDDNEPASVGRPLQDVELRLGKDDELLARSPGVMLGYWKNPQATAKAVDTDGWLHTGDKARIEDGRLYITGRLKDIIVLANGKKVPPADMEMAIGLDTLFEQVMVIGEARPFMSALVVPNQDEWAALCARQGLDPKQPDTFREASLKNAVRQRIARQLHTFPGFAQVRRVIFSPEPFTVDNGLLTPTMKLKRAEIERRFASAIEEMYSGH